MNKTATLVDMSMKGDIVIFRLSPKYEEIEYVKVAMMWTDITETGANYTVTVDAVELREDKYHVIKEVYHQRIRQGAFAVVCHAALMDWQGYSVKDVPAAIPEPKTDKTSIKNHSGKKYLRAIHSAVDPKQTIEIDIYSILDAYPSPHPAIPHAVKKLLCCGQRGKGDTLQDIQEAIDALYRAKQALEAKG